MWWAMQFHPRSPGLTGAYANFPRLKVTATKDRTSPILTERFPSLPSAVDCARGHHQKYYEVAEQHADGADAAGQNDAASPKSRLLCGLKLLPLRDNSSTQFDMSLEDAVHRIEGQLPGPASETRTVAQLCS